MRRNLQNMQRSEISTPPLDGEIMEVLVLSLGLKKGPFSPQNESDLAWVIRYAGGRETADLQGIGVFELLAELALEKAEG